eukprot:2935779-Rhodomonas_salina.4
MLCVVRYWPRLSCHAVSGTDLGYAATRVSRCQRAWYASPCDLLRACYAMSGTDLACTPLAATRVLCDSQY